MNNLLFPAEYRLTYGPYHVQNVGFSVPEMMLIAAECEARIGSVENAVDYINRLRDFRIMNNRQLSVENKALMIVLDECQSRDAIYWNDSLH